MERVKLIAQVPEPAGPRSGRYSARSGLSVGYGIHDLLDLLKRYRRLFLTVLFIGLAITLLTAVLMTPTYIASSAIVFDRNDARPYEQVEELRKQERDRSVMETELDVIKSRVFAGTIVDALDLVNDPDYNTYLERRNNENEGSIRLLVSSALRQISPPPGPEMIRSRLISVGVQRNRAITTLLGSYNVDRRGDSLAMSIEVRQTSPLKAAAIADAIAQHYVDWTAKLTDEATTNTIAYLRGQAGEIGARIAAMEREVAKFSADRHLTFDPKDDVLRARMELLNQQYAAATTDETTARSKYFEARAIIEGDNFASLSQVVTSEPLDRLRTEQSRIERLKAQLSSKFGRQHPLVMDADAELNANRRMMGEEAERIVEELKNVGDVAAARASKLSGDVVGLQQQIQARNLAEIRRRELERDLLAEQKRYDQVVLRLGDLDPERGEHKASAIVASFAEVPTVPAFPRPNVVIATGTVGSLLLSMLAVILFDVVDDRIFRPGDIEQLSGRPNLVSVPAAAVRFERGGSPFEAVLNDPASGFAKAMQNLCLAWRTIERRGTGRILMLCSPAAEEGKTTVSLGMAGAAAAANLRVALICFDPTSKGAGALIGATPPSILPRLADYTNDTSRAAEPTPHVDVIFARLTADETAPVWDSLRSAYDLVIIDAPNFDEEEGAVWLTGHSDAVVLVAAERRTHARTLSDLLGRLSISHPFILGSVLNTLPPPVDTGRWKEKFTFAQKWRDVLKTLSAWPASIYTGGLR